MKILAGASLSDRPRTELQSAIDHSAGPVLLDLEAGVYGEGLLTVIDAATAPLLLQPWSWLLGENRTALLTTAFGDVFFWQEASGVNFLNVQFAEVEFIDSDPDWFASEFLANPSVIEEVLRISRVQELVSAKGALSYGEAYLLEPWLMLGGADLIDHYIKGSCAVYLNLVAQMLRGSSYSPVRDA